MSCFERGDVVWYWSIQGGYDDGGKAIFIGHDKKGFAKRDCFLAIGLGRKTKRQKKMVHIFRWPIKLIEPLD